MVKMTISPQLVKRFNAFLIKISVVFPLRIGLLVLRFIWKSKCPGITKKNFKKNNEGGTCPIRYNKLTIKLQ